GVGAAILSPQTLVIVSAIFPARRRGAAFGILSGVTGLAALAGPTVGGLIVTYLDWRWIFFVNVPIGIAGIALALLLVPDLRPGKRHRLDLVGVALATAGLSGVVFGLIEGQRYEWGAAVGDLLRQPFSPVVEPVPPGQLEVAVREDVLALHAALGEPDECVLVVDRAPQAEVEVAPRVHARQAQDAAGAPLAPPRGVRGGFPPPYSPPPCRSAPRCG